MLTFDTPSPVLVVLDLAFGQVRIVASDSTETTVEVYPRDSDDQDDVRTAEHLRVDHVHGRLLVSVAEQDGSGGAIIVAIAVPTGSSLHGRGVAADFLGAGELGECRLSTGLGHIKLHRTGSLRLAAALGDITVDHAVGAVEVTADHGDVRLGLIEGRTTIRAKGEGDATMGEARGAACLNLEKGAIRISRAHANVEARTTHGDIDVAEVMQGSVVAVTTFGNIRVGVAETSGAHLSLDSATGTAYTSLSLLDTREQEVVCVEARTVIGDVVVERSGVQ
ncbi:DUF4097 family beta strand repeat-containing protein [Streptomyces sp. ACA25]|uniref:DUF4097 family beta strand repeat-containing protein n=1 Tax=Streptomyces sp. ACA25 TaxID=3022596 RepID=UPI002306F6D3|nr:DUF4097 family beta strand repeat-containing protein [Streptomyces sp. ACA25]MDB1086968.1 DUF4097 family beta strand repeat-containing protein [Streptomyces sp. ACA25]